MVDRLQIAWTLVDDEEEPCLTRNLIRHIRMEAFYLAFQLEPVVAFGAI